MASRQVEFENGAVIKTNVKNDWLNDTGTVSIPSDAKERTDRLAKIRNSSKLKNKIAIGAIAGVSSIALAVGIGVTVYKGVFRISSVNVLGDVKYTAEEIMAAAGFNYGDNLYSIDKSSAEAAIIETYPEINGVTFEFTAPSGVNIGISVAAESYYADIYGEVWSLDSEFRLIGKTTAVEAKANGLIKLKLPEVADAIAGGSLELTDKKIGRYIKKVADAILASGLSGRVTATDARDMYDVKIVVDGKYLVTLGDTDNLDEKLVFLSAVLEDKMFRSGNKATIDVSKISEASVIVNNQLDLEW